MEKWVLSSESLTDCGLVRTSNQDSYLARDDLQLYVVADGMGGHAGGEIASRLCVDEILSLLVADNELRTNSSHEQILQKLVSAVNSASTKIYENSLENPHLRGMGTTATLLCVLGGLAFWAHVGDSRLYLLRAGIIFQLTHDHSLVSEQLRAGLISEEEAQVHRLRNVITRSVGFQEEEEVDCGHLELEPGDSFMLCSDGLHGKVSRDELAERLMSNEPGVATELTKLALARGGDDNITVIVVRISQQ
jgi:PPM family protein phosphatase